MRLAVPLIRQPENSVECGPACIEMVMKYHGKRASRAQILKDVVLLDGGVFTAQIGAYFIKKGFSAEIQAMNPAAYLKGDIERPQGEILALLKKYDPEGDPSSAFSKSALINFMGNGGVYTPKLPTIGDIASELDAGNPIIASLTTRWHCGYPARLNFHYNVITGYDEKSIFTNDPGGKFGGKKEYLHDEFLFTLYAISRSLGSGSLLKVRPRAKKG